MKQSIFCAIFLIACLAGKAQTSDSSKMFIWDKTLPWLLRTIRDSLQAGITPVKQTIAATNAKLDTVKTTATATAIKTDSIKIAVSKTDSVITSAAPRYRINRDSALTLTTTWKRIAWTGKSSYNFNKFSKDTSTGKPFAYYDSTSALNLLRFSQKGDASFDMTFYFVTTPTLVNINSMLRYRLVIPKGKPDGTDFIFPFPDGPNYRDCYNVSIITGTLAVPISDPLYQSDNLRANGMYVEVSISTALTGVTLNNVALLIQQTR